MRKFFRAGTALRTASVVLFWPLFAKIAGAVMSAQSDKGGGEQETPNPGPAKYGMHKYPHKGPVRGGATNHKGQAPKELSMKPTPLTPAGNIARSKHR